MKPYDVVLVVEATGMVAHKIDCAEARELIQMGAMALNMFGAQRPLPDDIEKHSCLTKDRS